MISIWIFIGVLLIVYGFLIMGQGIWELFFPPDPPGGAGGIARAPLVGLAAVDHRSGLRRQELTLVRRGDQASMWLRKKWSRARRFFALSSSDRRFFSPAGSGLNALAAATFCSMCSILGMPTTADATGSDME